MGRLAAGICLSILFLAGCTSSPNQPNHQIRDLQATVAALQKQVSEFSATPLAQATAAAATNASPAATPPPAPTTRAAAQAATPTVQPAKGLLHAGDSAQIGALKIVFTGARFEPGGHDKYLSDEPTPGTLWLVLAFTVTNTGKQPATSTEFRTTVGKLVNGATIYNNVHNPIEILTSSLHPQLQDVSLDGNLQPGESLSGVTVREV